MIRRREIQMEVKVLVLGNVRTNCYIVFLPESKKAVIIDPADDFERIEAKINEYGLTPEAVLLTHGHFDHILAAEDVRGKYNVPIGIYKEEEKLLADPWENVSSRFMLPYGITADELYEDGQVLPYLNEMFRVIATPGHTVGGCCYYAEADRTLFSGDTIFRESVGRTDLPTGSEKVLWNSINEKLFTLPGRVLVYPGHGLETTILREKQFHGVS